MENGFRFIGKILRRPLTCPNRRLSISLLYDSLNLNPYKLIYARQNLSRALPQHHIQWRGLALGQGRRSKTLRKVDFLKGHVKNEPQRKKNTTITASEVRIIDIEGINKGVVPLAEALGIAKAQGGDLIQVAEGNPPVCRVIDEEAEAAKKKSQSKVNAEEIADIEKKMKSLKIFRLRPQIDSHDLGTKLTQASRNLEKGHPVKIVIQNVSAANQQKHRELIERIYDSLVETKIGHSLYNLSKLYSQPFILLSPFSLCERDAKSEVK